METFRPKIKLKGANKSADIVQSEGNQNQLKGLPTDSDTYAHHGEGFFPVITGGIKRKRAPRAGERKAKDKQPFMFNKVSTMQSVPTGEEDLLDEDDNAGKEGVEEGARMTDQRQVMSGRNRVNIEPVEVKSMEPFQQRQRHLKVKVKTSKSQEGSSVPPEKSTSSENEISPKYMKKYQKPASDNPEKLGNFVLKPARSLDQPTPRQGRPTNNETRSPLHGEMEKLHGNSENQEKHMVQLHQKHKTQSLAFEKGPSDQSEYNEKELMDALMVVKKIMKMDAAEPFNTPVNPVALGIPDYFDIIDTPMDLGTICSALERGEKYRNSRDVFKDVQFIWENCYTYNRKGDPILDLMKRVKKNFVKYWTAAGLYYESPKRTAGAQNSGQGDANLSHEHDGLDESEMEHQGRENPDGNKETQTGKMNFITPEQPSLNVSELKDDQVEQVAEESGRREEKVCQKSVEDIKVQHYGQESKAETDILQSTLKDPVIKNKGMKLKIKKSIYEYEAQENNGSIIEKEDPTSIGTDEESGPKTVDSAKSLQEETPHQDLHPKAKTRRRHGKYQHKDGCLCAVCVARRRRYAREENAHLAKGQAIMVDADMKEKMKEKVIEFPRKLLSNEDGIKLDYASSANLIAHPGEQGDDQKVESQKNVKGQEKEEICTNEGSGKHAQENRKKQFPGQKKLEMHLVKVTHQEEEKESLMQQREEEKESLMQLVGEEEQLDEKGSQKQEEEEVQEEEVKDGQTQDEEETQQQEEVDIQQHEVDSGGYHSADYDIPLQYANPSILQMCEVLFTRKCYSFRNQPHSLNYEPKKTLSENKILAAMSTFMD